MLDKEGKSMGIGRKNEADENRGKTEKSFIIMTHIIVMFLLLSAVPSYCKDKSILTIYTVNYPLMYFAERIGGKHVEVFFPAPSDVDPAYWTPDVETVVSYQQADLILLNGAGYAKWIVKATLPQSKLVDTSRSFRDRYIYMEEVLTHSHGPEGEHAHESLAFTTWIDFNLAAQQASAVAEAIIRKRPNLEKTFEKNYASLAQDLHKLDSDITALVSADQDQPLLGSHPVYDYLANRYGLNMKNLHWEPNEMPSRQQWAELQSILEEHPAQWMIWEGEPVASSVARLQELGVGSLVFDPCGNVPDNGDFMDMMRRNIENLRVVYK
jgi:zinc transport system substrate-binding protein